MNIEKLFKKQGYIIVKNENNKYIDSIERDILNVFKTKIIFKIFIITLIINI